MASPKLGPLNTPTRIFLHLPLLTYQVWANYSDTESHMLKKAEPPSAWTHT